MPDTETASEPKALRLARFLREFVSLRSTTIYDIGKYESVLWLGDLPQNQDCRSPAWQADFEPGDSWLEVRKQHFLKPPNPPDAILPWVDQNALRRALEEMPSILPSILMPDLGAEIGEGEEPPLVEHRISEHPEIQRAYDRYRPSWETWSAEYRRRESIQQVYAELFRLHTQVQKQGEIIELILGLGLLDWNDTKSTRVLRHIVTARIDLHFEPATGVIRLEPAADGAVLRIEDDMLDAERRPERSYYASVNEQLNAIGDEIWDRARMWTALKSWAGALHPDSQWSSELKPACSSVGKPMVSFAPALILRKRTQAGMVRIYDAIISRLNETNTSIPPGWLGLIEACSAMTDRPWETLGLEGEAESPAAPSNTQNRRRYFSHSLPIGNRNVL